MIILSTTISIMKSDPAITFMNVSIDLTGVLELVTCTVLELMSPVVLSYEIDNLCTFS